MNDHVAMGGVGRGMKPIIDTSQPPPTVGNSKWGTEPYDRAPGGEARKKYSRDRREHRGDRTRTYGQEADVHPDSSWPALRYHPRQLVGYEHGPQSGVKCFNCNGFGHMSRDCPLPPNPNQSRYTGGRDNRTESGYNNAGVADSYGMQEGRGGSYFGRVRRRGHHDDSSQRYGESAGAAYGYSLSQTDYPALGSSNSDGNSLKCHNCDKEGHYIRDCPEKPRCYTCGKRDHAPGQCPGGNRDLAARDESVSPDIVVQDETPSHNDSKRSKPKQSYNTDPHTLDETQYRNTVRISPPSATAFGGFPIGGHDQDFGVDPNLFEPKWDNVRIESDNRHVVESGEVDEETSHKPQTNRQPCQRCGQKGHKKYHCPVRKGDRAAGVTNKEDTISVDERSQFGTIGGNEIVEDQNKNLTLLTREPKAAVECFNCHEVGHFSRFCPLKHADDLAVSESGRPDHHSHNRFGCADNQAVDDLGRGQRVPWDKRECYNCHELGHLSRNCPKKQAPAAEDLVEPGSASVMMVADNSMIGSGGGQQQQAVSKNRKSTGRRESGDATSSVAGGNNVAVPPASSPTPPPATFRPSKERKRLDSDGGGKTRSRAVSDRWTRHGEDIANKYFGIAEPAPRRGVETQKASSTEPPSSVLTVAPLSPKKKAPSPPPAPKLTFTFTMVDQIAKLPELRRLLRSHRKDEQNCRCGPFAPKCTCTKRTLVLVDRIAAAEFAKMYLSAHGVEIGSIHDKTDEIERKRCLTKFKDGRYPALIVMSSQASNYTQDLETASVLVFFDLPAGISEFNDRVKMVNKKDKELNVTIFYDAWVDYPLAEGLAKVLEEGGHSIPEELAQEITKRKNESNKVEDDKGSDQEQNDDEWHSC